MGEAHGVYLGLGSNLGEREENIQKAISLIGERVGTVLRESSLIETEPWGFESENKFLNGVILVETELTPRQILNAVKAIEWDMGRRPPGKSTICGLQSKSKVKRKSNSRYTDRPIDIDILLYDDLTIDEPDLKIPHPLMHQRDFVMIPLNEIRQ
jgi:2-amino-4-hydroxy-6-hydroxymethyldihydropteridine diphosphokinase